MRFRLDEFLIPWCCLCWTFVDGQTPPMVATRLGKIRGVRMYADTRTPIMAFLGIPYAAPATSQNRFAPPERHMGWADDQPYDATKFGPACLQPRQELEPTFGSTPVQDEDCLTLNIWTADITVTYRNAPVLIFLEGEGFVSGYPGRLPGQDLASEGIVVVSVSYRLNVFGFLCLENQEARGNIGLLDQYLALVWVRENIEAFGGDPRSVTLMGHSAGAISIAYHMISPRTQGLFHRAIIMSGSIMSPWASSPSPSNASLEIAKSLGCLRPKTKAILTCLRSKSSEELLRAFETQYMYGNWSQLTLPVIDDFLSEDEQYLPLSPNEAFASGNYLKIPVLTGITANDGAVVTSQWSDMIQRGFSNMKHFYINSIIPAVAMKYNYTLSTHYSEIKTILQWYYIDPISSNDVMSLFSKIVDFYSDAQFKAPHDIQLKWLSNRTDPLSTVYAYQFEQEENYLYKKLNISGGGHGEELLMLFGPSLMKKIGKTRYTAAEERLSTTMRRFWMEFIRKGSLSSSPYGYGMSWNKYSPKEDNYVIFRADNNPLANQPVMRSPALSFTKDALAKQILWLWNELLPNLQGLEDNHVQKEPLFRPTEVQTAPKDVTYRSAMYTLVAFVIVLLILLIVCVILLKRHATERERDMF
ncbi:Carboxylesterase family [Nesidiocoris tenuis]|uniref:Carboxylic ester hydrolase n=1 Tax=Nesidiocoris tenuis TaxID=355587 RepID=A0ABN7AVJ5_9HEMI|nr:Carboxylesterase family [Nesidiocoris tenuis]